uniref:Uncharacterized protein n=1 Tax=Arundo donax TaxID=35708 RepID=A0A0A9BQN8_ARUDO
MFFGAHIFVFHISLHTKDVHNHSFFS